MEKRRDKRQTEERKRREEHVEQSETAVVSARSSAAIQPITSKLQAGPNQRQFLFSRSHFEHAHHKMLITSCSVSELGMFSCWDDNIHKDVCRALLLRCWDVEKHIASRTRHIRYVAVRRQGRSDGLNAPLCNS